jgi:hypothetical protein
VRVLHEELGPLRLVDERIHVARVGLRLLEPCVPAPLVRDSGAPDLRRVDRGEQVQVCKRLARDNLARTAKRRERIVVIEHLDGVAVQAPDADAAVCVDPDEAFQYVARPPLMS